MAIASLDPERLFLLRPGLLALRSMTPSACLLYFTLSYLFASKATCLISLKLLSLFPLSSPLFDFLGSPLLGCKLMDTRVGG